MQIKGYIIEKYNKMTNAYTCNRLVEEAKKLAIDLKIVGIHDTMITPREIRNKGELLEKREFLINRYKWGKEKDEINALAEKSYNSLTAYNVYINKYLGDSGNGGTTLDFLSPFMWRAPPLEMRWKPREIFPDNAGKGSLLSS